MRLQEAAKKYKLSTDDLIQLLRRAGYDIPDENATVSFDMVATVEKFTTRRRTTAKARKTAAKKTKAKKAEPSSLAGKKVVVVKRARRKAKAADKTVVVKKAETGEAPAAVKVKKAKAKAAEKTAVAKKAVVKKATTKKAAAKKATAKKAVSKKSDKTTAAGKTKAKATPEVSAPGKVKVATEKKTPPETQKVIAGDPEKTIRAGKPAAKVSADKPVPASKAEAKKAAPARGAAGPDAPAKRRGDKAGRSRPVPGRGRSTEAQQKAVRESVRRTLAKIETTRRSKRRKSKTTGAAATEAAPAKVARGATVREVAEALKMSSQDVIKRCFDLGMPVTITETLDPETIELIAEDAGVAVQLVADEVEELLKADVGIDPDRLRPRPPIVTVMGHVDHGKTSILDYIRRTRVASGEAGGITQHIGAYAVETKNGSVTFIDTPGHEAFTSMRARGARVTDIVVLVVAADDGLMPQTIEAIDHAKAADVPIIVAINKIDLPTANPAQVKQQLSERGIAVEEFGGEVVCVEVSAKTGDGIDKLLEMILLQAEVLELRADPDAPARAIAIEVKKEEGRGVLCTVLVTQGALTVGSAFVVGVNYGKVRALLDHRNRSVKKVLPGVPALLLGTDGLPEAGDQLVVVPGEREAREYALRRQQTQKDRERKSVRKLTLEEFYSQIQEGEVTELRLVIKADSDGSVEALTQSLSKLVAAEASVNVLHAGVGVISESDVLLASSSGALIIGFNVRVSAKAKELASRENVDIRTYTVIYEAITDVDEAMKGLLEPEKVERVLGRAEVRKVYNISRLGQIAGSFVLDGTILRNAQVRVLRGDEVIHEGRISSLKRFQDDAKEVQKDFECGIGVSGFNDLQEGDVLEVFVIEERARTF